VSNVVFKMSHLRVSAAMRTWILYVQNQARDHATMKQVLHRISKGFIWKGWSQWCRAIVVLKQEQRRHEQQVKMMTKMVLRMTHGRTYGFHIYIYRFPHVDFCQIRWISLYVYSYFFVFSNDHACGFVVPIGAFRSWMGHVTRMQQAAKVLRKIQNSQLSYAWRSWRDVVQLRRRRESVMATVVRRMTHGLLSGAWRSWRDVVQYSERCECVMMKVVRRMTHGFLGRGMSCCPQMMERLIYASWINT
jgi:hypothetical protein